MMVYRKITKIGTSLIPFGGIERVKKDEVVDGKPVTGNTSILTPAGVLTQYLPLTDAEHTSLLSKVEASAFSGVIFTLDLTGSTPVLS